jgi:hypothetical protein
MGTALPKSALPKSALPKSITHGRGSGYAASHHHLVLEISTMRTASVCLLFSMSIACLGGPALAAEADKAPTPQQTKMSTCQKEAGEKQLTGKDRQAFVNDCLKAKPEAPAAAASATQGQRLGACSKEAAAQGLKGDERNKYLSTCAKR